jgi:arylamine N-acetyltransferase
VAMTTDLPAYFARIGYTGQAEPTVETLHAVVAAHNRTIPFENLDPLVDLEARVDAVLDS